MTAMHYQPQPQYVIVARNGHATASLILGIIAVLFCWVPFLGVVAWPLGILGVILGGVGYGRARARIAPGGGAAIAGLVASAVALGVCVLYLAVFTAAVGTPPA